MVGNQYPDIFFLELAYDGLNIFYGNGVYTGKGFIQKYKTWINCQ
jgi:hypothetical protein